MDSGICDELYEKRTAIYELEINLHIQKNVHEAG